MAFLSSTKFFPSVSSVCREREVPLLCGVGTVAEVTSAISYGASAIFKVYPVSSMTSDDVKRIVTVIKSAGNGARVVAAGGVQQMAPIDLLRWGIDGVALGYDMTKNTPQSVVRDFASYVNEWEAAMAAVQNGRPE